jgi:hypothetical protein
MISFLKKHIKDIEIQPSETLGVYHRGIAFEIAKAYELSGRPLFKGEENRFKKDIEKFEIFQKKIEKELVFTNLYSLKEEPNPPKTHRKINEVLKSPRPASSLSVSIVTQGFKARTPSKNDLDQSQYSPMANSS